MHNSQLNKLQTLQQQATKQRHRLTILLAGEESDGLPLSHSISEALQPNTPCKVFGHANTEQSNHHPISEIKSFIGQELDCVVYNAHAGFDPDAFGLLSGTIRAGGLLLITTPDLHQWPNTFDPQASRLTVFPIPAEEVTSRYIKRLVSLISKNFSKHTLSSLISVYHLNQPPISVNNSHVNKPIQTPYLTDDQQQAATQILEFALSKQSTALTITADRGRGKSALLGLIAAQLQEQGLNKIIVTAPNKKAVDTLFKHYQQYLDNLPEKPSSPQMQFLSPDSLLTEKPDAQLLLVDEAAAIPLPSLNKMLSYYKKIIFSSTMHGYEGGGRGFALRFNDLLNHQTTTAIKLQLKTPIRYDETDPLERFVDRSLLLDAEFESDHKPTIRQTSQLTFTTLNRDELYKDEPLLRTLFALFVQAHYQTRPMDLRQMLDGPNLSLHMLHDATNVFAVAMLATEGGLQDTELQQQIILGKRRPQGHLLPQLLAYQHMNTAFSEMCLGRIVRIAVHPDYQQQGIGSQLMQHLLKFAEDHHFDGLGAVFGASVELLHFWKKRSFIPLHLGIKRNASSSHHSVAVLKALSKKCQLASDTAQTRFQLNFNLQRQGSLQQLSESIGDLLLTTETPAECQTIAADSFNKELSAYINGSRDFESSLYAIRQAVESRHPNKGFNLLSFEQQRLVQEKVLRNQSWATLSCYQSSSGKRVAEQKLRRALSHLDDM